MDLQVCRKLKKLSNLSSATNLEEIIAFDCESLVEIDSSISSLPKLVCLYLTGCKKLKMVPEIPRGITDLHLSESGVEEWSPSIQSLDHLHILDMSDCKSITCFPVHLTLNFDDSYPTSLRLRGCEKLHKLPEITGNLIDMDLSRTAIKELPQSIRFLSSLVQLRLSGCSELEILPHNICELKHLVNLYLEGCSKLRKLPNLHGLSSLERLTLGGTALEEIPDDIDSLSSLTFLSLKKCKNLKIIPNNICELKSLRELNLSGCSKLKKLPPLFGLKSLRELNLSGCSKLKKLPPLFGLTSLESLYLMKCKRLQALPQLPQQLGLLLVQNCTSLTTVELSLYTPPFEDYKRKEVNYCNCRNLDENARSNILSHAHLSLNQMTSQRNIDYYSTNVGIPGFEIPERYRLQSQGSSISIPLKSSQINTEFLRFDVSIVVESNSKFYKTLYFEYECRIKNASGQQIWSFNCGMEMGLFASLESDHVFLWYNNVYGPSYYDLRDWLIENKSNVNEASFEFKAYGINNEDHDDKSVYERNPRNEDETLKIKKCGVNLMYDKEDKKWKGSRDQTNGSPTSDSLQQAEETNTALVPSSSSITIAGSFGQAKDRDTKKRTRESEEEESQPKRRKH